MKEALDCEIFLVSNLEKLLRTIREIYILMNYNTSLFHHKL